MTKAEIEKKREPDNKAAERDQKLALIKRSKAWRLALFFHRIRIMLIPQGSFRARVLRKLVRFFTYPWSKNEINQGLRNDLANEEYPSRKYEFVKNRYEKLNGTDFTRDGVDSKGIILMYHRVADVESDPLSLSVSPRHFTEHLEVLKQLAYPLRLGQLYRNSDITHFPSPWVAITFDDGYADHLHHVSGILKRFNMPATFFLASGYLGSKTGYWEDELEQMVLSPGILPPLRDLHINGRIYHVGWGATNSYTEKDYQRNRYWREKDKDPSPRHILFRLLYSILEVQPEQERQELLNTLHIWSGKTPVVSSDQQILSLEEVIILAHEELFEIGAHTMTHCYLASLSKDQQRMEINKGKDFLEKLLGCPIPTFAYPYGSYTEETISLIQEAGFTCAVTVNESHVDSTTNRFQLPRVMVKDWPGDKFAAILSLFLES